MLNYPINERPREKAIKNGINSLSNQELLALILRTGNKQMSVLELSQHLLNEIGGFNQLKTIDYYQLIKINGIKSAKAIEILASVEIAKRLSSFKETRQYIKEPMDGYCVVKDQLLFEKQEKVILLCMNHRLELIKEKLLFIGSDQASLLTGKEVFKEALLCGASQIMLIHNHPSGHPEPSIQDQQMTKHLMNMAKKLEIEMVDHLIIGDHCFYSFASDRIYHLN